jgi:hypothetical protein
VATPAEPDRPGGAGRPTGAAGRLGALNDDGLRNLAAAVIVRAVKDAAGRDAFLGRTWRRQALTWLRQPDRWAFLWCEVLGVDATALAGLVQDGPQGLRLDPKIRDLLHPTRAQPGTDDGEDAVCQP